MLALLAGCPDKEQRAIPAVQTNPAASTDTDANTAGTGTAASNTTAGGDDDGDGKRIGEPELPPAIKLLGCTEQLEHTTENFPKDGKQWTWKYRCRSREPFDRTVEAMNASGYIHNLDQSGGSAERIAATHHYVGEDNDRTWDVDLKAFGNVTELRVTYIVTRAGQW